MRTVRLTLEQAKIFWTQGSRIPKEVLDLLEPGEVIVGLGSYGSSAIEDQYVLSVGTELERQQHIAGG